MKEVIGLIFDMDGVIVDSTATHTEAWIAYLRRFGISADNLSSRMLGKHNTDLVRDLFGSSVLTDEVVLDHGARKEALYREMMAPELPKRLVPGVREFLTAHADHPMAVATNAEPANVHFVLENASLASFFRAVVDGSQVARPKPDPEVFVTAARLLGHAPEDCVIFEDSLTGVAAARAAGATVVGVATTLTELPGVDLMIRDFLDSKLQPWFRELQVTR